MKWRSTRLPNFRIKKKSVPVEVIERVTHYSCRVLSPKKFIEKELACLAWYRIKVHALLRAYQ